MTTPGVARTAADLRDDQRHVQRRLVGEQPVRQLAVIAERFAVIAGDDDQSSDATSRAAASSSGPSALSTYATSPRYGLSRYCGVERRRRRVGRMRIEHVHPGEPRLLLPPIHAIARGHDHARRAARRARSRRLRVPSRPTVVVDVEAAVEAESRSSGNAPTNAPVAKPRALQHRREGRRAGVEPEAGVVAHAVLIRIRARSGCWCATASVTTVCACANVKRDAARGERDRGSASRRGRRNAEGVGAQRVDRDRAGRSDPADLTNAGKRSTVRPAQPDQRDRRRDGSTAAPATSGMRLRETGVRGSGTGAADGRCR